MKKFLVFAALAAMMLNMAACGEVDQIQTEVTPESRETESVVDAEEIALHHTARTAPFAAALDAAGQVVQQAADAYVPPLRTEDGALLLTYEDLVARTADPEEVTAMAAWFENTLFIGDSRTVGIGTYFDPAGADFFALTGMSVFDVLKAEVKLDEQAPDGTEVDLQTLLTQKQYDKIYIMLGINELGSSVERIAAKYEEVTTVVRSLQPDAQIWLQANMHVSKGRSEKDAVHNNPRIDALNIAIRGIADRQKFGWLDVNVLFDDAEGHLSMEYTFDHTHILGKHYKYWGQWIYLQSADQMEQMS